MPEPPKTGAAAAAEPVREYRDQWATPSQFSAEAIGPWGGGSRPDRSVYHREEKSSRVAPAPVMSGPSNEHQMSGGDYDETSSIRSVSVRHEDPLWYTKRWYNPEIYGPDVIEWQ